MKFLFASDSYKGSLTSEQITGLLKTAAEANFPGCETAGLPVADGGEGTVDAVIAAVDGKIVNVKITESHTYSLIGELCNE